MNGASTAVPADRLPLQPLLDALPIDRHLARPDTRGPGPIAQAALMLNLSPRTLYRMQAKGLDAWTADHLAITAGLHPLNVWGQAWAEAARGPAARQVNPPLPAR